MLQYCECGNLKNLEDKYCMECAIVKIKPKQTALDVQISGDHYKKMKIQPVEYILANGLTFIEGSVIKYVSRWKSKNGVEDLKKAKHFLDILIENEEKEKESANVYGTK